MRLTLLHFNDLHGRLDQLPRLFTLIRRERGAAQAAGRQVLLLDAGDSSDRAAWESDITQGRANFAVLEAMGVQATVVGNGEALHWGRRALARLVASVHFPVLAANLVAAADPGRLAVPGLLGSAVLDCGGWPLGVVGLTAMYPGGYERFGYEAADPRPALRRELDALRSRGARTRLLLSHLGGPRPEAEKQRFARPYELTDDVIAAEFPELDVIVGGHTHTPLAAPVVVGKTVIVQAGDYGRYLGRLDVDLDPESGRVEGYAGRLLPCDSAVPPEATISATLELVREEAGRLLEAPVGRLAAGLPHTLAGPSPLAARVADVLREVCAADLAILYSGFARRGLAAGVIRRRDLYEALPGSTHVTAAEVSGAQIQRMVEQMLRSKYRSESFNPRRQAPPLGLPAASSNVRLEYDPAANRLLQAEIDGQPLDPAGRYRLASTFFTLSPITGDPEYDFIGLEPGQVVENIRPEQVLWEVVEGYVKEKGGW